MSSLRPRLLFFGLFLLLLAASCGMEEELVAPPGSPPGNNPPPPPPPGEWSIPRDQVLDGGPGKDGIPSIERPRFDYARDVDFLDPADLVIGVKVGEDIKAYPHPVLDWHEIVNDEVGDRFVALTYCPLTGTGIAWDREIGGSVTTFGVSGLLYNSNLIPYDRATDSHWSQILLESVEGELSGRRIETFPVVETTWATWLAMFPDSRVMTTNTGFDRNYDFYPYGSYRTNHELLVAPIAPDDDRLPRKDRGMGVIDDRAARFYPLEEFAGEVSVVTDRFAGKDLVIVGSGELNFLVAYERTLDDGTQLDFSPAPAADWPAVMTDPEGNAWNVFGEAVAGPRQGTALRPVTSFIGYWMAWGSFYPGLSIFER